MNSARTLSLACVLLLGACAAETKGAEDDAIPDGKLDSFFSPIQHGTLALGGTPPFAELSRTERFHAWDFELDGHASISLELRPYGRANYTIDTVMYLYREADSGWGRYIAKNDDQANTLWSRIETDLDPGRYRIIIKGYSRYDVGLYSVWSTCAGDGCSVDEPACGEDLMTCRILPTCIQDGRIVEETGPCDWLCVNPETCEPECESDTDCPTPRCLVPGPCPSLMCNVHGECVDRVSEPSACSTAPMFCEVYATCERPDREVATTGPCSWLCVDPASCEPDCRTNADCPQPLCLPGGPCPSAICDDHGECVETQQ